jgi:hypothetical protein
MIERRSVEQALAEIEEIRRRYWRGINEAGVGQKLRLDEALSLVRKLGFTKGEALRLLRPKGRG